MLNPEISSKKEQVKNIVNKLNNLYNTRNIDEVLSLFGNNASIYGTGKDEHRTGVAEIKEQYLRDWSQSESGSLELVDIDINIDGNFAWVISEVKPTVIISGKTYNFENLRCTQVLKFKNNEWAFVHCHWSWPFPEQNSGASFPDNK